MVTPGTSGYVLTSDGTNWISSASSGGTSVSVGSTPPSSPSIGAMWWNDTTHTMFIYYSNSGNPCWIEEITNLTNLSVPDCNGGDGTTADTATIDGNL